MIETAKTTAPSGSVRILVADDHAVVRKAALAHDARPDMELVGEAKDGVEAVARLALRPDVILMDIVMPRMDSRNHGQHHGQESRRTRLDTDQFRGGREALPGHPGWGGGLPAEGLVPAGTAAGDSGCARRPRVAESQHCPPGDTRDQPAGGPPDDRGPATERESEVLQLLAQGMSNAEIARDLVTGERTVGTHVSNILSKLHLANRTQAALYALRQPPGTRR